MFKWIFWGAVFALIIFSILWGLFSIVLDYHFGQPILSLCRDLITALEVVI